MKRTSKRPVPSVLVAIVVLAAIAITSCGTQAPALPTSEPQSASAAAQSAGAAPPATQAAAAHGGTVTGLWQGTSTAACRALQPDARRCNAVVKITLRIFQQGLALSGDYTCAIGTMVCRNTNTTGVIAYGEVREGGMVALRVMLPDGSSCLFNGRPAGDAMTGTYFCMQGGGYVEQGRFALERTY